MKQLFQDAIDNRKGWQITLTDWLVVLLGLGFTQGSLAVTLIVVARQVSFVEYGQYLACYGLLSLLVVLPNFGLDAWMLAGGPGILDVATSWKKAFGLRLLLLAAWLGTIFILNVFLPAETFRFEIILPTALGIIFDSLTLLSYTAWRVQNLHRRVSTFQIVSSVSLLTITFLLQLKPGQIVLFSMVRAAISVMTLVIVLIQTIQNLKPGSEILTTNRLLRASRPFVLADVATSIYLKADLTIASIFLGSTGAGTYGPALNLTNLLFMIPNALYFIAVPTLSKYFQHDQQSFRKFGAVQMIVQAISGIVLALLVFEFAPVVVQIAFGSTYRASGIAFRLMSPILFLKSLNFALGALLTAGNYQTWRTTVQVISALFNLIANLIVVVPIGITGIIFVYTFSELLLFIGYSIPIFKWWFRKEVFNPS